MIQAQRRAVGSAMTDAIIVTIALALALSAAMIFAWHIALRTGRSGWIDATWSLAVGAAGVVAALAPAGNAAPSARQMLVASMVAAWSLRLGVHIATRTKAGGDDPRYAQLREDWGVRARPRLFWFLQVQAAVALLLALAVGVAAHRPTPSLDLGDLAGVLVLLVAVVGEGLADRQLADFRKRAVGRGGICTVGLWRYTRHPNYFFEWLAWLAYAVMAIDPGGAYPLGWAAIAAPALMYWLLVHVSGIPPLEAYMERSRGDRFHAYRDKVNAFWPGPSRLSSVHRRPEFLP
jgi:steroid 5-alpha reductase family enzyme